MTLYPELIQAELLDNLSKLNEINECLNQAVDVQGALNTSLAKLVQLMELQSGWIFLQDPAAKERFAGPGYSLTAHYNLPPAMGLENPQAWNGHCTCQGLCLEGKLTGAYNQVCCSRLASVRGDRQGLKVHATAPLRAGGQVLGILNVAGADWSSFNDQALALLRHVGSQMGIALERARLYDLLRERHIHEQMALLEVTSQLLRSQNLDQLTSYLVEEARRLLQADACALLLPSKTSNDLVFRSSTGWRSNPETHRRQIPLNGTSGAGKVMRSQRPLLVEDIETYDPAPWLPEWLQVEQFRGHAMMPLIADEQPIGILALDMRRPRVLDEMEVRFLRLMANQAALAIENARLHEEELQRQRLEQELNLAQEIQLSLLPKHCPQLPGWDFGVFYQAARQVSGDFYDFFSLPDEPDRLGLVIADVSGKGVPAALFMAHCRTLIRTTALHRDSPADALTKAHELILRDNHSDLYVTVFYGMLDIRSGLLTFASAGHNRPLWLDGTSGEFRELSVRGIILGNLEEFELDERAIEVAPGDVLVFYTDGVTESRNTRGDCFGEERLRRAIAKDPRAGAQEIIRKVVQAIQTFTGEAAQADDFTLIVVKRDAE